MSRPVDLDAARRALADHRGPSYRAVETERGDDGEDCPVAWEATCRCGVVTRDYETHLLTSIAEAARDDVLAEVRALRAKVETVRVMADRWVDSADPMKRACGTGLDIALTWQ